MSPKAASGCAEPCASISSMRTSPDVRATIAAVSRIMSHCSCASHHPTWGLAVVARSSRRVSDSGGAVARPWGLAPPKSWGPFDCIKGHHPLAGMMAPLCSRGWRDLNPRPLRPERSALPNCATPALLLRIPAVSAPSAAGAASWLPADRPQPDRCIRIGSKPGAHVQRGALVEDSPLARRGRCRSW